MLVSSSQKIKPSDKVPHKIYQVSYKPGFLEDLMIKLQLGGHKLEFMFTMQEKLAGLCEAAVNSTELLEELKGFDLIVYDSLAYCGTLIGEYLGIPKVEVIPTAPNAGPFGLIHMIPMPVSYVPQPLTGFTDKMTFMERVMNFGTYLGGAVMLNLLFARPMDALKAKYNIKPERSFLEAAGDTELVIITADFALEYPQPLLPGMWRTKLIYWEG